MGSQNWVLAWNRPESKQNLTLGPRLETKLRRSRREENQRNLAGLDVERVVVDVRGSELDKDLWLRRCCVVFGSYPECKQGQITSSSSPSASTTHQHQTPPTDIPQNRFSRRLPILLGCSFRKASPSTAVRGAQIRLKEGGML